MKRRHFQVPITLCVVAVVLVEGILHLRRVHAERSFSRDLAASVHSGQSTVHLRSIPSPAWERVYIFGYYTLPEEITSALGFEWSSPDAEALQNSDSVNLLVFVRQRHVVMSILHDCNGGDFGPDSAGYNYAWDDAEFCIDCSPHHKWLRISPVPNLRNVPNSSPRRSSWISPSAR